jgi:hypothetical protein
LIDEERPRKKQPKAADGEIDWEDYHDLDTIYAWLDKLVAEYPNILNLTINGYSAEGRPIKMITLSKKPVIKTLCLLIIASYYYLIQ